MSSPVVATVLAVVDATQRHSALEARLQVVGADAFVHDLDATWRAALRGDAQARTATVALATWLHALRASPLHAALRDASEGAGLTLAGALLAAGPARRELPGRAWRAEQTLARHVAFVLPPFRRPRLRVPIFGLAAVRGGGVQIHRGQLARLLRLLDEPNVTLRTVVGIATERPLEGAIATALAAHPRWWAERAVRDALVANPFTPSTLVLPLLPTVFRHQLVRFCAPVSRSDALARAARIILEVRDVESE